MKTIHRFSLLPSRAGQDIILEMPRRTEALFVGIRPSDFATNETEALVHFKGSSARTILDVWLKYNGIIGYTDQFIRVFEGIRGASQ